MKYRKPDHLRAANAGKIKISIMIPAYNSANTIRESILSAINQDCPYKEIVVVDDASTDNTVDIAKSYENVRVVQNKDNMGIGVNLANCFTEAKSQYILFLCGDDVFTDSSVASDVIDIFENQKDVGVIDRPYYQFINGHKGAVTRVDEENIYISSCCPSGMAFRKMKVWGSNRIFIEMPLIVVQYLKEKWSWVRMKYDTVAVRIHPGGNTGTLSTYYTESTVKLYTEFLGKPFAYYPLFIQLKNRAPKMLKEEIKMMVDLNPACKKDKMFWVCSITARVVPTFILRRLSAFYRHRISRRKAYIIPRTIGA